MILTVPRIYSPRAIGSQDVIYLGKNDIRYVRDVLRMNIGRRVILFDGSGWEYEAVIKKIMAADVVVEVIGQSKITEREIRATLIQALPKANKMDFIVQKSTELGADEIIPFRSERTILNLSEEKSAARIERWRQIAVEASRQSGRADIPAIKSVLSFDEVIALPLDKAIKLIFWEEENQTSLKRLFKNEQLQEAKDFAFIVGPEGGFSKQEVDKAQKAGFISVSLGRQVLKVETAAVTILSIIQYEKGAFSGS